MPLLAWSSVHVRWIDAGLDLVELLQNTANWQGQERQKLEFFRTTYWPTAILWVQPCFAWSHRTKADSKAKLERWVALSEGLIADLADLQPRKGRPAQQPPQDHEKTT